MKRYTSVLLILILLLPLLTAATKLDARKIALEQANLRAGWTFVSKQAGQSATRRMFKDAAGNILETYVVVRKTKSSARFWYGDILGEDLAAGVVISRSAPTAPYDHYTGVIDEDYNGTPLKTYYALRNNIVLFFTYIGPNLPSDKAMRDCESLMLARIVTPSKAGQCPIAARTANP